MSNLEGSSLDNVEFLSNISFTINQPDQSTRSINQFNSIQIKCWYLTSQSHHHLQRAQDQKLTKKINEIKWINLVNDLNLRPP